MEKYRVIIQMLEEIARRHPKTFRSPGKLAPVEFIFACYAIGEKDDCSIDDMNTAVSRYRKLIRKCCANGLRPGGGGAPVPCNYQLLIAWRSATIAAPPRLGPSRSTTSRFIRRELGDHHDSDVSNAPAGFTTTGQGDSHSEQTIGVDRRGAGGIGGGTHSAFANVFWLWPPRNDLSAYRRAFSEQSGSRRHVASILPPTAPTWQKMKEYGQGDRFHAGGVEQRGEGRPARNVISSPYKSQTSLRIGLPLTCTPFGCCLPPTGWGWGGLFFWNLRLESSGVDWLQAHPGSESESRRRQRQCKGVRRPSRTQHERPTAGLGRTRGAVGLNLARVLAALEKTAANAKQKKFRKP
ncbi:hypothetical protein BDK51DRAFT_51698 [Blyttiomyces helicus]|uniref:Uncharacterized protein n=1 Tax=Blyttiomyces helicus TaxID=388810 RepID=A0A4P9VZT9_9FUNG|nr:hypothetical protein BDK51DRAFT_51698 [Blyttiomyces helicus]|eukprot:RKO85304.1 hypothetical protein BDK51DRAFT_51698 [Blyttiomyces helicus]